MDTPLRGLLGSDLLSFSEQVFETLEPSTAYLPNWHIEYLAYNLARLADGEVQRMVINQPPRSGKSMLASVALPMFMLGRDPACQVMTISHTADLARKFNLDRRRIANTSWYRELFPGVTLEVARDMELQTTAGGGCFASGMVGGITGRGADVIIIDDPLKGADSLSKARRAEVNAAYDNQVSTRLNQKRDGKILIVMQRLHEDDLVGHVLKKGEWHVVVLPAIATEKGTYQLSAEPLDVYERPAGEPLHAARDPMRILEAERRSQGSLVFEAQYQQNPLPAAGNVIHREWIRSFDVEPERFDRIVTSWDTASTLSEAADYSVGTVWGTKGADFYLLEVHRGRWETPELRQTIIELDRAVEPDANLIEDTDIGRAVRQELARTVGLRLIPVRPKFDKEARLLAQAPRFEAGQVHLPRQAPWLGEYLSELLGFPNSRHDDQVDSTSQALYWLTARNAVTLRRQLASEPEGSHEPSSRARYLTTHLDPIRRDMRRRDLIRRDIKRK